MSKIGLKVNVNTNSNIKINNNYQKRVVNTSNSLNKNTSLSNPKVSVNISNKLSLDTNLKGINKINVTPSYYKKNEKLAKLITNKSIEIKNNSVNNSINSMSNINNIHSSNVVSKNKPSISSLDQDNISINSSKNIKETKGVIKSDPKDKINKFYNNRNINLVNNNNNFLIKSKNVNVNNDSLINPGLEYKENDSRNDYFDDMNYYQDVNININQSINNGDNYKKLYVEDNGESMYKKIKKIQNDFENDFNYNMVNNEYNQRNNRNIQNNLITNKSMINNTNISNNSYKPQIQGIIKVVKENKNNNMKDPNTYNLNTDSTNNNSKYNNQLNNQYLKQGQRQSGSINFNQKIASSISTSTKNVTIIDDYYDSQKVNKPNSSNISNVLKSKDISLKSGSNPYNKQDKQDLNGNINVGSKRIIQEVKYQLKMNK